MMCGPVVHTFALHRHGTVGLGASLKSAAAGSGEKKKTTAVATRTRSSAKPDTSCILQPDNDNNNPAADYITTLPSNPPQQPVEATPTPTHTQKPPSATPTDSVNAIKKAKMAAEEAKAGGNSAKRRRTSGAQKKAREEKTTGSAQQAKADVNSAKRRHTSSAQMAHQEEGTTGSPQLPVELSDGVCVQALPVEPQREIMTERTTTAVATAAAAPAAVSTAVSTVTNIAVAGYGQLLKMCVEVRDRMAQPGITNEQLADAEKNAEQLQKQVEEIGAMLIDSNNA